MPAASLSRSTPHPAFISHRVNPETALVPPLTFAPEITILLLYSDTQVEGQFLISIVDRE
jgi:hypothetical protein